jgi:chromosome segregation ATPase
MENATLEMILNEMRQGFAQIDTRLDKIEIRLDRVEARLDRVEARLDRVESDIRKLRVDVQKMQSGLEHAFKDIGIIGDKVFA